MARKDHCFRPHFLSISCKLILELTWVRGLIDEIV